MPDHLAKFSSRLGNDNTLDEVDTSYYTIIMQQQTLRQNTRSYYYRSALELGGADFAVRAT